MSKFHRVRVLILIASALSVFQHPHAEDLQSIQARISDLESSLAGEKVEYENAREEVLRIERQLHSARQANLDLRSQLDSKLHHIAELRRQREVAEQAHQASAQQLDEILRAHFRQSRSSKLKVLLGATNISAMQRNLRYYEYLARANKIALQSRNEQLRELLGLEAALKLEATKLRQIRSTAEVHFNDLKSAFDIRNRVARSLEKLMHNNQRALNQLRDDENKLTDLVGEVTDERRTTESAVTSFSGLKGNLVWPTSGRIAKAPGSAMRDGGAKWSGVIIESDPGSNVVAIAPGRVAFADWFRNLGLLLIVDHGEGYMSLYGHNQEIFKKPGDPVQTGERLALVGDTGGRSTVGLYFEIRANGMPQDPRQWCKK